MRRSYARDRHGVFRRQFESLLISIGAAHFGTLTQNSRGLARLDAGAKLPPAAGLEDPSIIEFGPFSIDERERMLRRHGQPVPLTPKAVDVLLALVERPGRLITKDELVQRVWPDTFVEESNLAYNIFTLRKALGDTADNPEYVETIPKRGYRFKAPVRRLNGRPRLVWGRDQGTRSGFAFSRDSALSRTADPPL